MAGLWNSLILSKNIDFNKAYRLDLSPEMVHHVLNSWQDLYTGIETQHTPTHFWIFVTVFWSTYSKKSSSKDESGCEKAALVQNLGYTALWIFVGPEEIGQWSGLTWLKWHELKMGYRHLIAVILENVKKRTFPYNYFYLDENIFGKLNRCCLFRWPNPNELLRKEALQHEKG